MLSLEVAAAGVRKASDASGIPDELGTSSNALENSARLHCKTLAITCVVAVLCAGVLMPWAASLMFWADTIRGNYTTHLIVPAWTNDDVDLALTNPRVHAFLVPNSVVLGLCFVPLLSFILVWMYGWARLRSTVQRVSVPWAVVHVAALYGSAVAGVAHQHLAYDLITGLYFVVGATGTFLLFWKAGKAVDEPKLWHIGAFLCFFGSAAVALYSWYVLPAYTRATFTTAFVLRVVVHTVTKVGMVGVSTVLLLRLKNTSRAYSTVLLVPVICFLTFAARMMQLTSPSTLYVTVTEACLSVLGVVETTVKLSRQSPLVFFRSLLWTRGGGGRAAKSGPVAVMFTPGIHEPPRRGSDHVTMWDGALFYVTIVKCLSMCEAVSVLLGVAFLLVARVNINETGGAPLSAKRVLTNGAIVVAFEVVVSDYVSAFINARYGLRLNQYDMRQTWARRPPMLQRCILVCQILMGCWVANLAFGQLCVTEFDGESVLTPCPS